MHKVHEALGSTQASRWDRRCYLVCSRAKRRARMMRQAVTSPTQEQRMRCSARVRGRLCGEMDRLDPDRRLGAQRRSRRHDRGGAPPQRGDGRGLAGWSRRASTAAGMPRGRAAPGARRALGGWGGGCSACGRGEAPAPAPAAGSGSARAGAGVGDPAVAGRKDAPLASGEGRLPRGTGGTFTSSSSLLAS